jgi:hypothetical protein
MQRTGEAIKSTSLFLFSELLHKLQPFSQYAQCISLMNTRHPGLDLFYMWGNIGERYLSRHFPAFKYINLWVLNIRSYDLKLTWKYAN